MTSRTSSTQVSPDPSLALGGKEILVQNAGMDATTQFEDINHSVRAFKDMEELYIGDFVNPEDNKESWEDYVRRK